jgi:hypothetical protein
MQLLMLNNTLALVGISAVIVDSTLSLHLIDSILNARRHLRHREPIFVVTSNTNFNYFEQKSWQIANVHVVRNLPMPTSVNAYSDMLVSCNFWRRFHTEYILIFQSDSRFCSTSPYDIQEFAEYGFPHIGAPWDEVKNMGTIRAVGSRVGNGGFSLRQRSAMLASCIEGPNFKRQFLNEDAHFSNYFATHSDVWKICPTNIAEQFSAEGYYAGNGSTPLAVHKVYQYIGHNNSIYRNCPEAEILYHNHP